MHINDLKGIEFKALVDELGEIAQQVHQGTEKRMDIMLLVSENNGHSAFVGYGEKKRMLGRALAVIGAAAQCILDSRHVAQLEKITGEIARQVRDDNRGDGEGSSITDNSTADEMIRFLDELLAKVEK